MKFSELVPRLENAQRQRDGSYMARCPAHEDKTNSLHVSPKGADDFLLKCFAGCSFDDVLAAYTNGTTRTVPQSKAEKSAAFSFTEREVLTLAERLIAEWKSGGPAADFLRSRGISRDASLLLRWGITERYFPKIKANSSCISIPLYHDDELVGVKYRAFPVKDYISEEGTNTSGLYGRPDPQQKEILFLEGPLDVALAASHGFNAVGIQSAEVTPRREDLELLGSYPTVFLIGDADPAGRKAVLRWQTELNTDWKEVIVRPDYIGHKDIGELYASDQPNFRATLQAILRSARASREYFEPDDLLTESELRNTAVIVEPFAVDRLITRGRINMFFGEEKSGKSLLAHYIGKCVTNGVRVFGKYDVVRMPILSLDLENTHGDLDLTAALFRRIGPVLITYKTRQTRCPALNAPGLLRYCARYKPLLILDSQTRFTSAYFERRFPGKGSQWNPDHMTGFYEELLDLCAVGATIIIIHHCTRDEVERYANSYVIGASVSRAFAIDSTDRPSLNRVRLIGKLFRGGPPLSEDLIAFPVIAEHGHFGLDAKHSLTPLETLVQFVKDREAAHQVTMAKDVKNRKGIRKQTSLNLLHEAVEKRLLLWEPRHPVSSVPDGGNQRERTIPFPVPGTNRNEPEDDPFNVN